MIFGLLMISNARKRHMQIAADNNTRRKDLSRSKDRQLIRMLLVQVIIVICCTAPFATVNIFYKMVRYADEPVYNRKIKLFFDNICRLILYFNPMIEFYIYTLSSRAFRTEIKRVMKRGCKFVYEKFGLQQCFSKRQQNQIVVLSLSVSQ
ncbi:unnamed protein product [Rotaria socialis]|nr:unnamed protein product [Rotaria socialis]